MARRDTQRVALAMIVKGTKDEAPLLDGCLKAIHKHVDGLFLLLNAPKGQKVAIEIRAIAKKYKSHNIDYTWKGNFVDARNQNFAQVPKDYDWILWLDSDDLVDKPEKIRQVANAAGKHVQGIYVNYDYGHDEYGNVTVNHWVARMVRNNGSFAWSSSFDEGEIAVHETLSATRTVSTAASKEFSVIHQDSDERATASLRRNIEMLQSMYERQHAKGNVDPRVLYYLGTHLFDAGAYQQTINILTLYLQKSGWAEERSAAHVFIGRILKTPAFDDPAHARTAFLLALGEYPHNNDACLELGILEFKAQRYPQALAWLERGQHKQDVHTMVAFHRQYELYMLMAECLVQIGGGKLDDAMVYAEKALKLRPKDPEAIQARDRIAELVEHKENVRAVARIIRDMEEKKSKKIIAFLDSLPDSLQDSPVVVFARQKHTPPKVWPKKSMAIYVGQGPMGVWGPWSLKDGIGGSEEAVIQLSKELAQLGWKVVVFATPGNRAGLHDSVIWKPYWMFNYNDTYDTVIAWRNPGFFNLGLKARKKYVWMHDVMEKEEFAPDVLASLDKVIFLSKYHRSLFPNVPDDKVFLSSNGIVPEDFEAEDGKHKRNPRRVIYMSSHVRGLELLYRIWPEVRRAVPDAKLDIYYGWESFVNILKDNPDRMAWRQKMIDTAKKLKGVTDHGKISHQQIVKEIQGSGVWAYPCPFPEIYCITAIKAQAGGAVPVSSTFAALKETVKYGALIPMQGTPEDKAVSEWKEKDVTLFKDSLISMLLDTERQETIRKQMIPWARTQSWAKVAKQWDEELS